MPLQSVLGSPRLLWILSHSISNTVYATARREPAMALQTLGWEVLLVGKGANDQTKMAGVSTCQIKAPKIYLIGQILFHLRVIRLTLQNWSDVDVVMFHQTSAIWMFLLKICFIVTGKKCPLFVLDTRDLPDFAPGDLKLQIRKLYHDMVYWIAGRFTDGQTTITNRMADLVKINRKQLLGVWPSGVNLKNFVPAKRKRVWPMSEDTIQLIYIGSIVKKRNLLNLCYAVEKANHMGMRFRLLLVGKGRYQDVVSRFSDKTEGRIILKPSVPHSQIPGLLAQAHVGITSLPDPDEKKYQASSPIKLFEYMASGLPIIAIRSACHTDAVGKAPYVIWAEKPEIDSLLLSLKELWSQFNKLSELGKQASLAAENWTWQASAHKLSDALLKGLEKTHGNESV